ncbi:dihydrolipoyl dehydrogenase family protein [Streptomyces sp. URMC 123]|uniref:dihydrolipoyl dehydrogenase family protein n=1 Tax=Streptomyces sp. URMC 123 TaxID=3423403 RepID=UPI003F1A2BF1
MSRTPETVVEDAYDVVVLGAGPTGENLADRVRAAGLTVAVVESELVGGECSYWACMPSKALLRPMAARAAAGAVAGAREAVSGPLDADAVLARRDSFAAHWKDDGQVSWLDSVGAELIRGRGRLDGPRRVAVEGPDGGRRLLTARRAVAVCTGSRALLPELPGLAEARPWTSREATSAKEVPGRLAVVGGGVVGVEMAAAWRALGSEVTLLVRGDRLLPRMEPFVGEYVAEGLSRAGVEIRTGTSVTAVRRRPEDGMVSVTVTLTADNGRTEAPAARGGTGRGASSAGGGSDSTNAGPGSTGAGERAADGAERRTDGPANRTDRTGRRTDVVVDEVLFATGRAPRTDDLGLETVGLEPGSWLEVDDTCLVKGVPGEWLYAVGDANHRSLLTHQGKYQARIAGAAIGARARGGPALETGPWGAHAATADAAGAPQVVFTEPEVAAVGLTAEQARRRGLRVRVVDYDLGRVAGAALYADDYRGRARMVVDLDREVPVGVAFVGPGVGELLHAATVAVVGEVPLDRLWHAVPAYPTVSEVWLRLLETYRDEP